jgi:hypothetical protein
MDRLLADVSVYDYLKDVNKKTLIDFHSQKENEYEDYPLIPRIILPMLNVKIINETKETMRNKLKDGKSRLDIMKEANDLSELVRYMFNHCDEFKLDEVEEQLVVEKEQPVIEEESDIEEDWNRWDSGDEHVNIEKPPNPQEEIKEEIVEKEFVKIDVISEEKRTFKWKKNQRDGFENAIKTDFTTGIHSQATGSGKSLMALKIIWEYHKRYPKDTVMWFSERQDIPLNLFLSRVEDEDGNYKYIYDIEKYKFWKENDIIDMSKFCIMEYVSDVDKKKNWLKDINNYNGQKPLFLIFNRACLTAYRKSDKKYKFEMIKNNIPKFIILDECHSAMASVTYSMLLKFKKEWEAKIHGLSATPYRSGKSLQGRQIDIKNCDEEMLRERDNEQKLLNVFGKRRPFDELNIISWFNLKDAIETGVILPPVFKWFKVETDGSEDQNKIDQESVMETLNEMMSHCVYKKCVVWCRLINNTDEWLDSFEKQKDKYDHLKKVKLYIDHSKTGKINLEQKNGYEDFYKEEGNALMFCANKFKEGSDIPNLDCCVFLDKVKKRGELPFIQCIGRVLRHDDKNLKKVGYILEGCEVTNDKTKMKDVCDKLVGYYVRLYEIAKSGYEIAVNGDDLPKSKIRTYNDIMKSLKIDAKRNLIHIKLGERDIPIDIRHIEMTTTEWDNIHPTFEKVLKDTLILSDKEEYEIYKATVQKYNFDSKKEYIRRWEDLRGLCYLTKNGEKKMIDPEERYRGYFTNWHDLLGINTEFFPKTKEEWFEYCKLLNIKSVEDYYEACDRNKKLSCMPWDFYKEFGNLNDYFDSKIKRVKNV